MIPTTFDELNKLVGYKRSMSIDKYFDEMRISTEQKRIRKAFARELEDEMIWLMSFLFYSRNQALQMYALQEVLDRYRNAVRQYADIDPYIDNRIRESMASVIAVTSRHSDDPYFYSKDRARIISEGESNVIFSHTEFEEASKKKSRKQWLTIMDGHERDSHGEVNGLIIPINELFELQGGYVAYPRDISHGVDDSEIMGCRCSLRFF